MSELQHRLDDSMAREVQIESEMAQEKRARLEEKNSINEKLIKVEKQLEHEKTKFTQSAKGIQAYHTSFYFVCIYFVKPIKNLKILANQ